MRVLFAGGWIFESHWNGGVDGCRRFSGLFRNGLMQGSERFIVHLASPLHPEVLREPAAEVSTSATESGGAWAQTRERRVIDEAEVVSSGSIRKNTTSSPRSVREPCRRRSFRATSSGPVGKLMLESRSAGGHFTTTLLTPLPAATSIVHGGAPTESEDTSPSGRDLRQRRPLHASSSDTAGIATSIRSTCLVSGSRAR
jgi:hypothetical protein